MLTEEEKSRIRSEEVFRLAVIRELEGRSLRPSLSKRFWLLLNSSFALWFLSSVVLAGLTGWFESYQARHNEQIRKTEIARRLDTEIGNRMFQALAGLRLDEQRIKQKPSFPPRSIYSNVVLSDPRQNTDRLSNQYIKRIPNLACSHVKLVEWFACCSSWSVSLLDVSALAVIWFWKTWRCGNNSAF
jgi:hypothetical protein